MKFVLKIASISACLTFLLTACGGGGGGGGQTGGGGGASSFTVTSAAGTNGSMSPTGPKVVATGGTAVFTVTPASGYSAAVSGCGGSLAGNLYTTGAITADCTVTASFIPSQFTVTPSAGSNGTITPGTAQSVAYNGTSSFTVTPASGFGIVSVTGCGGSLSGSTYTTGAITGDCTVSASFVTNQYPVTTRIVSGSGSIACTPVSPVTAGTAVNCTLNPGTGFQLTNLLDNLANVTGSVSGAGLYSIPGISSAHNLEATFSLKQYTVTPAAGANGTITPGSAQTVAHGAQPGFTITPDTGYHIASASGCGGTLSGTTFTAAPVTGDCTVTAAFARYTSGILSLSVAAEPFTLGFLEVDAQLPVGVRPTDVAAGDGTDVFDISPSVTPTPLAATYTVSTRTIKLTYLKDIGIGSLAAVNLTLTPASSVTAASFPAKASVLTATGVAPALANISNPSSVIQVPVTVQLN